MQQTSLFRKIIEKDHIESLIQIFEQNEKISLIQISVIVNVMGFHARSIGEKH